MSDEIPFEPLGQERADASGIFRGVQSAITFIVGSVAVLTACGFVIVNVSLAHYTVIQGYSINTGQYITAAVGAILFAGFGVAAIFAFLFPLLYIVAATVLLRKTPTNMLIKSLKILISPEFMSLTLREIWKYIRAQRSNRISACVLAVLYVAFYAVSLYNGVPRFIGGGQPVPIRIVFKDAKEVSLFGFTADAAQPNIATHIELLSELSDGILVYDSEHGAASAIKNDEIAGIADASADLSPLATATPAATAAATP